MGCAHGCFFGRCARDRDDESEIGFDEGRLGSLRAADLLFETGDSVVGCLSPVGKGGGTVILYGG